MDTNVKGVFFLTQRLLPLLEAGATAEDPARVINIGSDRRHPHARVRHRLLRAVQGRVHTLTRQLAARLVKRNIILNAIAPGPFPTWMLSTGVGHRRRCRGHRLGRHRQADAPRPDRHARGHRRARDLPGVEGRRLHRRRGHHLRRRRRRLLTLRGRPRYSRGMTAVEVYVDPSCPWAWLTSRWIKEVAPQRDLDVTWPSYCLEIRDDYDVAPTMPAEHRDRRSRATPSRTGCCGSWKRRAPRHDEDAVDALYTAWGPRFFERARGRRDAARRVPRRLRARRRSRRRGRRREVGRADRRVDGHRLRVRRPEDPDPDDRRARRSAPRLQGPGHVTGAHRRGRARLWDAILVLSAEPGFFEITRPRANPPRVKH